MRDLLSAKLGGHGQYVSADHGLTVPATFMAVARQGLFFIPTVWILALTLGLPGIQMAQMVADLLTFLCSVPIQIWVLKKLSQPQK